jgi:dihydropteroate synthase
VVAQHFAGMILGRPLLMAVVNVTPDSFSGGFANTDDATAHARRLIEEGADILDIGGESTRPGAHPVGAAEECERVVPVIKALAPLGVPLAVDSYKPEVMAAALNAGATIVNDVFALAKGGLAVAATRRPWLILGHSRGDPPTMNVAPEYRDVVAEVRDDLAERIAACATAGIPRDRIAVDPGLGFGKKRRHNLALLQGLADLAALGCPLCVGASRKFAPREAAAEIKLATSIAAAVIAARNGAHILRVHDVAATRAALALLAV